MPQETTENENSRKRTNLTIMPAPKIMAKDDKDDTSKCVINLKKLVLSDSQVKTKQIEPISKLKLFLRF
jgi:hypothetical protein